jgi:sugar lactone lactonase YvrE
MRKPAIQPQRWTPPRAIAASHPLPMRNLTVHPLPGDGPEHVMPRNNGHLLTGLNNGRVIDYNPETHEHTVVVDTGGRPLGVAWHPDGSLLICDSARGLLRCPADGSVDTLAAGYNGIAFTFCSNVTAASDGTIYFTHASTKFTETTWAGDLFEHRPTGRLFRLTPDGDLDLLVDHLAFANGVTLAPDESFVVVAETTRYDLLRLELTGQRQGTITRFGAALAGFPDNITTCSDGNIWIAMPGPRVALIDRLLPRNPVWRKALWALPDRLQPRSEPSCTVRVLNPHGDIVHDFYGVNPGFANPTAVCRIAAHAWKARPVFARTSLLQPARNSVRSGPTAVS